jgi:hypothetical protein
MPERGQSFEHIDDVDHGTFEKWKSCEPGVCYQLQRNPDLVPRAQQVHPGDSLTLIDSNTREQPQLHFGITSVVRGIEPGAFHVGLEPVE